MKKLLSFLIAFTASICSLYAQSKTITGKVIDDMSCYPIPGVIIMIHDTVVVGKTNLDGVFQIDIPVSEKKITWIQHSNATSMGKSMNC